MKQERRKVQKYGKITFENLEYKSEHLKGIAGEIVSIRYDPQDITTILVYERLSDSTEQFLDYAHAQGKTFTALKTATNKLIGRLDMILRKSAIRSLRQGYKKGRSRHLTTSDVFN